MPPTWEEEENLEHERDEGVGTAGIGEGFVAPPHDVGVRVLVGVRVNPKGAPGNRVQGEA